MPRRLVMRIALFLLLGAIVNVAVAWGCVLAIKPGPHWRHDFYNGPRAYFARRVQGPGVIRVDVIEKGLAPNIERIRSTIPFEQTIPNWAIGFFDIPELAGREPNRLDEARTHIMVIEARGWPYLSLWGGLKSPAGNLTILYAKQGIALKQRRLWIIPLGSWSSPTPFDALRWLPLHPIWPGFAINTIFYALIVWPLVAAPLALRRRRRIRRGLCPRCAYDLRGGSHSACPECGAPLARKARTH